MNVKIPKTLTQKEQESVQYVTAMLNTDLYFVRFYEYAGDMNNTEAFERLEADLKALCGVNRYSDYESFRQMRHRYVCKIKNSNKNV